MWYGAIRFAISIEDMNLLHKLENRFLPIFGSERYLQPVPNHVDSSVFGTVPLQLYMATGDKIYKEMGLWYADSQWRLPATLDKDNHYQALLSKGLSWQSRYWIDDMYMITALQVQAYLATNDRVYLDRAAVEMAFYLKELQQQNGLFYHAPDAPFYWGRGNGWVAAGMAELIKVLPEEHPLYSEITNSYKKMMKAILKYQRKNGLWGQLVDDKGSWDETSGSAMFTYAMIVGIHRGVLDSDSYGPAMRKAWHALVQHIDAEGNLDMVCEGTNKLNDKDYYLNRRTFKGNLHGQAPIIWCASELMKH